MNYLHVVLHCVFAVTAEFTSRKFNPHVGGKQGTAPSGAATVSITVNDVRECLQLCQENAVLNDCRAANYDWRTKACDLVDDYATEITDVSGKTYWELVIGEEIPSKRIRVLFHYNSGQIWAQAKNLR